MNLLQSKLVCFSPQQQVSQGFPSKSRAFIIAFSTESGTFCKSPNISLLVFPLSLSQASPQIPQRLFTERVGVLHIWCHLFKEALSLYPSHPKQHPAPIPHDVIHTLIYFNGIYESYIYLPASGTSTMATVVLMGLLQHLGSGQCLEYRPHSVNTC